MWSNSLLIRAAASGAFLEKNTVDITPYGNMFWTSESPNRRSVYDTNYRGLNLIVNFGGTPPIPFDVSMWWHTITATPNVTADDKLSYYLGAPDIHFEYNGQNVGDDILLFIPPEEQ